MNDADRAMTILRIREDFRYAYHMLGAVDLAGSMGQGELHGPPPPHLLTFHDNFIKAVQAGERHIQTIAATGTYKSTCANSHALQLLMRKNPHVLLGTASPDLKESTTVLLRDTCEVIFGAEGELWTKTAFTLPHWIKATRDPNYLGATLGRQIEGVHQNDGIQDDIHDQRSEKSQAARDEVDGWDQRTYGKRLNPGAVVWRLGSTWHDADILIRGIQMGWHTDIYPLFRCPCPEELKHYPNVHHHGQDYDHLYPERDGHLTPEMYMELEKITKQTFELRSQCNPFGVRGKVFDPMWPMTVPALPPKTHISEVWVGDDPRDVGADEGSEASLMVLGYAPRARDLNGELGVIYGLGNWAGHWTAEEVEDKCLWVIRTHNPRYWIVEKSAIAGGHIDWLKRHTPLAEHQVIEQPPGGDKDARINSTAPYFRSGKCQLIVPELDVREPDIPGSCRGAYRQLLAQPGGVMKDRADSFEVGARSKLAKPQSSGRPPMFLRKKWD